MSSNTLFLAALTVPILVVGASVLLSRKIKLWPLIVFSMLICWVLLVFSCSASLSALMRGSSADNDYALCLIGWIFLLGWIPASVYCGLWCAFFKLIVLRELQLKTDK